MTYNGFPATYNPMYQMNYPQEQHAMSQSIQTPQTAPYAPQNANSALMFVNGVQEANAWVVQPGQRAFLMDRNENTFYVKSVNDNGMPNPLEIYDYKKRNEQPKAEAPRVDTSDFITREEFEERLAKLTKKPTARRSTKKEGEDE